MTSEELMIPRYKVNEQGYPDMPFSPNEIIILASKDHHAKEQYCFITKSRNFWYEPFFNRFPNIFSKLQWWEERKEKDMPEYVKSVNGNEVYKRVSRVDGAQNAIVQFEDGIYGKGSIGPIGLLNLLPATEQEYNDYITSKNKI